MAIKSETWLYVASGDDGELQGEGTKCCDGEDVLVSAKAMAAALGCLIAIVIKVGSEVVIMDVFVG